MVGKGVTTEVTERRKLLKFTQYDTANLNRPVIRKDGISNLKTTHCSQFKMKTEKSITHHFPQTLNLQLYMEQLTLKL